MQEKIYLGIGSNLGNREWNLYLAYKECKTILNGIRVADVFESLPLYNTAQPQFLNTVFSGYTQLSPYQLLEHISRIETFLGRDRKVAAKKGARSIDLDILLFGNQCLQTEMLTIPHPLMREREFVLKPLLQLDENLKDPISGQNFSAFYKKISKQGVYFHSAWGYIANSFLQEDR